MCGIFGWCFRRKARLSIGKREALASVLALANATRGDKSWGLYAHTKQGPILRKQVGDISNVREFSRYGRVNAFMGHTRQPTMGKITQKNAHPFVVGKITLAHNGTVSNVSELDRKYSRNVKVDSQHFAHHLNDGLPFADIEGYGAVEWINSDYPERIFLCRMRNGQLSVRGIRNDKNQDVGVVWSSDQRHLEQAIGVARLDSFPFERLEEGEVLFTEQGGLYKSDMKKLALSEPKWTGYRGGGSYGYSHFSEDYGYWESREQNLWTWHPASGYGGGSYVHGSAKPDEEDETRLYGGYYGMD